MHIVWFKRDLRVQDHAALNQAIAAGGPIIPLYIVEPELWAQPDMSGRQYAFLKECLEHLDQQLRSLGSCLTLRIGSAVQVLETLNQEQAITTLYSHQETWNAWTCERDKQVAQWCQTQSIPWYEPSQNGVIRKLKNRDDWLPEWYAHVKAPKFKPPQSLPQNQIKGDPIPSANDLGLVYDPCLGRQHGGRKSATSLLNSFLIDRGETYTRAMSSPLTAFDACSRLSPHLAFGTLSIREAFQAAENAKSSGPKSALWTSARRSFASRLRWHCHFIQRLEDETTMEFQNLHPAYDNLRPIDHMKLKAWKAGQTGYPFIDACMRALNHTGWLNFRMRSMLMSFASYHLWLDWREPALHLARQFTDYEPGIHYSQVQMQSGTTGMNAIRVYNPIKQSLDQDPKGVFIKRWVPELRHISSNLIHTPWLTPDKLAGYPHPIVEEKQARSEAFEQLFTIRRALGHKATATTIIQKHGSRVRKSLAKRKKRPSILQSELPL